MTDAHLKALLEDATPGPWMRGGKCGGSTMSVYCGDEVGSRVADCDNGHYQRALYASNAALIAQAPTLAAEVLRLREALRSVRGEICQGPVNDTLWHREIPAETTVDFITNTLNDGWDYDEWLTGRAALEVDND